MSQQRERREPSERTPRQAKKRYLARRRNDATEATVKAFHGRLKLFVEWCEGVGIATVGDLKPYDVNDYFDLRSGEAAPSTVEGEMYTLKGFIEFLEQMGAVDDLAEKVPIPDVPDHARSDDTKLAEEDALALLTHYRESDAFGTRAHVLLELAWFLGVRQGSLRALDLRDVDTTDDYVEFHHRPSTDTPLKNKYQGERVVGLPAEVSKAIAFFVEKYRNDVHDEHGRQPLLASARGRPTSNTVRVWTYMATLPCSYGPCPHGKDVPTCEWTERNAASTCPSSRSPHQIRTGSVTWQLNSGVPIDVVSERVNATREVIEEHYDKPDPDELWQRRRDQMERRRTYVDRLSLTTDDE